MTFLSLWKYIVNSDHIHPRVVQRWQVALVAWEVVHLSKKTRREFDDVYRLLNEKQDKEKPVKK
ncbi:hypothetical protein N7478_001901 [Penicillium angulare]|uniref:uncharacterized protein n=1 Tax=Penicillium angulare TaxID=116970 RepID=UPI00254029D0|nr:uncharacterized protein N7478_001901 [Penicillium angulare]KAJ5288871.1 hypothetical protein N7478_001901 [Penicillium angulare]